MGKKTKIFSIDSLMYIYILIHLNQQLQQYKAAGYQPGSSSSSLKTLEDKPKENGQLDEQQQQQLQNKVSLLTYLTHDSNHENNFNYTHTPIAQYLKQFISIIIHNHFFWPIGCGSIDIKILN